MKDLLARQAHLINYLSLQYIDGIVYGDGKSAPSSDSFGLCSCGFAFVRVELSLNFPLSLFVVSR
jgi:hypothetical protein